ncbi:MAG TPA: EAL domain-containing response regulator [Alphaproteobacteria bacterium]|nr:EAL domain-containing response regulator [Alphaproteobacteria bacterium]
MSKTRLLIVDDENDICELIADVAEARGFEVKMVTDPLAVDQALHEFKPDALMLDLMMPGIDGVELLRNLGDAIQGKAVVLMSGHDSRVLNSAKRLGAAHGINVVATQEKPLDIDSLRATLDKLSQSHAAHEAQMAPVEGGLKESLVMLYYQPIVAFEGGRIKGLEALARYKSPQGTVVMPDQFLSQLDEAAMKEFTNQVMALAVRDAAQLHKEGFPLAVSINMTISTLIDLAVPDRLEQLCKQHGIAPEKINVEVTEGEAMREVRTVMDVLTRLRLRGFGLAIDDFGVGYSSLRELQRLPFGVMKMDKSFVLDMAENRDSQVIAHAIIELGHSLSLKVVAEGIESARVWNLLRERKCDFAQGYFIAKPMPYADLLTWLRGNNGVFSP